MTDIPDTVPENAICDACKKPIGMESACSVMEIDEETGEEIGDLIWFHNACLEGNA
jgi:hypothetical protein